MPIPMKFPERQVMPSGGDLYLACGVCGGKKHRAQVLPKGDIARVRYLVCSSCITVSEIDDSALAGRVKLIRPGTMRLKCLPCGGNDMLVHVHPPEEGQTSGVEWLVRFLQCADLDCSNLWEVGADATIGGTGQVTMKQRAS